MMEKHLNIRVTGKVQGVFYRASCAREANRLGIKGIVKNMPDGSVYIEAEGQSEKLKMFVEWCKEGPPHARVDEVIVEESEPVHYQDFKIVY